MKTRIRFLINTLSGGGAEKVLVDLLRQLDSDVYDISLVAVAGGVHLAAIPEHISVRIIAGKSKLLQKIVYKLPPKLFSLLFLRGSHDVEIAYLEGKPTRFLAAKKTRGTKIAFVHCDLSVKNIIAPLYRDIETCLKEYKGYSKVCFVSEKSRQGFEAVIGSLENGCVVHNVVDFDRIKKLASEPNGTEYKTKGWKLVTVGRLIATKGYERLLRIVSELEKKYDLELWILGEGEERAALESMIKELEITSVRLLGFQENPYSFVRKADLFVCSSFSEGYSTAVTEAVALGVPVITTDCAGMDEILDRGGRGFIVENSEESLLNGLVRVFENREQYDDLREKIQAKSKLLSNHNAMKEYSGLFSNN